MTPDKLQNFKKTEAARVRAFKNKNKDLSTKHRAGIKGL